MVYLYVGFTLLWALFLAMVFWGQKKILSLDKLTARPEGDKLSVSVVIAVRNGESDIGETLKPLLGNLALNEIIVVNDRSSDKTQSILASLERENKRLRIIEITDLPAGWLGKVHAIDQGMKAATGDYVLFTDADVMIDSTAIKKALSACLTYKLDHLGVLPRIERGGFFYNMMMSTSVFLFTVSSKPWVSVEKRDSAYVKGVGAFNFVKRESFLKTAGFEWLKMDVADDVALAQLMAMNGGRSMLMRAGEGRPSLHWYENFKGMVYGLEKNIVGGFTNYRLSLVILIPFISLLVSLLPAAGLFIPHPAVFYSAVVCFFLTILFSLMVKKHSAFSFFEILFFPLGISVLGLILVRSSVICFKNGGIKWSGSFYPLKELKAGTRVKLGL
nr:glycosyltransferase family 2 protein [Bacteriovorax sp. HI3]